MKWLDAPRLRRIEHLGLSKSELGALSAAFCAINESATVKFGGDPVLACRGAPMLLCDMIRRVVAASLKMGLGAQDSALSMCKALDELCSLTLEGGWIQEEDSYWADRDPAAHALYNDMPKLALMLIDHGASVEAQLHDGEPLLIWFAKNAGGMLQDIIDRGPDLNARGRSGGTFLHHLSWLEKFDGEEPLGLYKRVIAKAQARGMDLNVADHKGRAPLHWAAQMGDMALARALVEAGANTLALGSESLAPWEEAGSERVAEYLEAAALSSREALELNDMGREKAFMAGSAALDLMAKGLLWIDGKRARGINDLLDAKTKYKNKAILAVADSEKRKRL